MFIVCLTIFSSILSPLQEVSYVKVHVYCVFDYFLFNLVSTSVGELRESACLLCVWLFSLQSCLHFSEVSYVKVNVYCGVWLFSLQSFFVSTSVGELRESVCLLCVWLFSLQSCLHFRRWVIWKCIFIVCLTIFFLILSPLQSVSYVKVYVYCVFVTVSYGKVYVYCVFDYFLFNLVSTSGGELYESAFFNCVFDYFLFNLVSTSGGELCESTMFIVFDYFLFNLVSTSARWVTWKCMFIVCLTIFSSILSPLQPVSYVKVYDLLCVWLFSLQSCLHFSRWVTWKCMFIVCLTIFSSILSPLQPVSYVKVHVYCVFDYFLFNLVSTSAGELRESACLLCVWLFSLQSCLHFSRWVRWKCMFIVCLTIFSSILSPLNSAGELRESVCLLCVWLFSLQSCLHFRWWVTWKCMFIVCLTIFSSILSPLQPVSYVKVHVYCVFDYFLFNLVSTSVGELRESACLLCVWLFSLQSCLHFSRWVTWKCMFIVCLTIFSLILSPLQRVSYVKVFSLQSCLHFRRWVTWKSCLLCVWLFSLQSCLHSGGELRESVSTSCLLCVWLFSLQSCLHFRRWVIWKCMFIVCLTIFSSILSPLQSVSYVKVYVYCVFDYFLFNLVST